MAPVTAVWGGCVHIQLPCVALWNVTSFSISSVNVNYIWGRPKDQDITHFHCIAIELLLVLPKMKATPLKTLDKRFSLIDSERRFHKACDQIDLLNGKLSDLRFRFTKACQHNSRSYQNRLKLRLAIIQGLVQFYHTYAYSKAETVSHLRRELFGEEVRIIGPDHTSDSESDDDYWA